MNKLNKEKQKQVVSALVEGASINSVVRMTGVSKPTILKLLADLGREKSFPLARTIAEL
jgi:transposase